MTNREEEQTVLRSKLALKFYIDAVEDQQSLWEETIEAIT